MGVSVAAVQWVKSVLISTANLFLESFTMIKPRALRKLPECDRCLLYSHNPFLLCAVHPTGPKGDNCLDFRTDAEAENRQFEDFLGLESTGVLTKNTGKAA